MRQMRPCVVVAVRIAEVVLHVADQRIEPVADVQRAVGAELEIDRAEVRVARLQQRIDRIGGEAGACLRCILYCSMPWKPMQLLSR